MTLYTKSENFSIHEIKDAISDVANGSAAGPDEVTKSTVRHAEPEKNKDLFNRFLEKGRIPTSMKAFKMQIQRGNEGVLINVELLRHCIRQNVTRRQGISYAYLDMRKAFDSIKHFALLEVLALNGIPKKLIQLLADMYTGNKSVLQNGDGLDLERGVMQGDPISPLLFNMVLDEALLSIKDQGEVGFGFTDPNKSKDYITGIGYLAYADDLVVFAKGAPQLTQKIRDLVKRMHKFGLRLNAEKSTICHLISKQGKVVVDNNPIHKCTIEGKEIPMMGPKDDYRYLGVQIDAMGLLVKPPLTELKLKLDRLEKCPLKSQHKIEVIRDILMCQVVYSLGISKSPKGHVGKFEKALMVFIRKTIGLPDDTVMALIHADPALAGEQ